MERAVAARRLSWKWALVLLAGLVVALLSAGRVWGASDDSITSPDTEGLTGAWPSLALDEFGNPVIAYHDLSKATLKILHCDDPFCDGVGDSITEPYSGTGASNVGQFPSLVLDENGFPVVAHHDTEQLHILRCNDPDCAGGDEDTYETNVDEGGVGRFPSLALDENGFPWVAFFDSERTDLNLLHCNDPICAGGDDFVYLRGTFPNPLDIGRYPSMVLNSDDLPVIAYFEATNGELHLLVCESEPCNADNNRIT